MPFDLIIFVFKYCFYLFLKKKNMEYLILNFNNINPIKYFVKNQFILF
jgi:hypothetical protein